MAATNTGAAGASASAAVPLRAGPVLISLILLAAVANLPLAVANVALPSIGLHFNASQTQLNLGAVSYSLGLAVSVLWFGAVGDRYGRKQMLLAGMGISVVACLVDAWAPTIQVLIGARFAGGLAAGMAYPTTLSLITALWGPIRPVTPATRSCSWSCSPAETMTILLPRLCNTGAARFPDGKRRLRDTPPTAVHPREGNATGPAARHAGSRG